MKKQNNGKLSGPEVVRAEYLKMMNSPNYRKKIKRSVTMLEVYNKLCRNSTIKHNSIVNAAKYFAEDIRTSNSKPQQEQPQDDTILPTKPIKI